MGRKRIRLTGILKAIVVAALLFSIGTGLGVRVLGSSFWLAFEAGRLETAKRLEVSGGQLEGINDDVLKLLYGSSMKEENAARFDKAELEHLGDVGEVFGDIFIARDASFFVLALFGLFALLGRRRWWDGYLRSLMYAGFINLGGMVMLAVLAVIDFDLVFERFHQLLFKAGTWLFEPGSTLIMLYPEQFWIDSMVGCVSIVSAVMLAAIAISSYLLFFDGRD